MTAPRGSIAVVIPTRDGARYIEETLRSALAQTRPPDDIVVVDDGSTDTTTEIVARFEAVRLITNAGTGGNAARATGVADTKSDYVALLDHDDVWFPHHLEMIAGLLDGASNPAAFSRFKAFSGELEPEPPCAARGEPFDLWRDFPVNHPGGPSSVVVRRTALGRIGGWPTWDRRGSDAYVWYRLADLGPFLEWPVVTSGWRRHAASMTAAAYLDDPANYLAGSLALLRDALDIHLTRNPSDTARLTADFDDFVALTDLVSALSRDDVRAVTTIVEDLGAREYLRDDLTMNVQRGLLSVVGRPSAAQRNVWRNFRSWPRRQRSLRRRIVDPILTHAIATGFEKRPFDPGSWAIPWSPGALAVLACLLPSAVRAGSRRFTRRYRYSTLAPGGADRRVSST